MSENNMNALITGAARGIGRAVAMKLAAEGCNLVICDVLSSEAEATAAEIREKYGCRALALTADVTNAAQVSDMIKATVAGLGSIDVLVNNAGITRDGLSLTMQESDWDLVVAVNLKGTFICSQAAAREMMKKRFGRIVNMASVSGLLGTAGQGNYAASKAGVIALTKTMARELGSRNITVNAVAPGFIMTDMTEKLPEKARQDYLAQIPLRRAGTVEDVAAAVAFLVSPAASYITGTVLNVSGGLLI